MVIDSCTKEPITGVLEFSSWKVADGSIEYYYSTKCFSFSGEAAHLFMHKINEIARKHGLTVDQRDELIIKILDEKAGKVNVYCK